MNSLDKDFAAGLLEASRPPCLSLYQPTHRRHPENKEDPIRFRNLVKRLEKSLRKEYPTREIQPLLEPFLRLARDRDFWKHTLDGLAAFGSEGLFRVYTLQRSVPELAIVADSFHAKPLMRIVQSADRYQILGLNQHEVKLFEGNRDVLDEIGVAKGVPTTMTEALGSELTEPHQTVASYGGVGGGRQAMHHGHGGKESEDKVDRIRFFRAVDRGVLEHHSKPSGLPLILAALPEHHHLFHEVSANQFLLKGSIDVHPDAVPIDELRERAWRIIEPQYHQRLSALVEQFGKAKSEGLGSDQLDEVAKAVVAGRVATLLVEADRVIPGRVNATSGEIEFSELTDPEVDDVLDDLGALALKKSGQVIMVMAQRMPTKRGIAAIYRH